MRICFVAILFAMCLCGCAGKNFTNLGNGTGVPNETIDAYVKEHDVSREQARLELIEQIESREK